MNSSNFARINVMASQLPQSPLFSASSVLTSNASILQTLSFPFFQDKKSYLYQYEDDMKRTRSIRTRRRRGVVFVSNKEDSELSRTLSAASTSTAQEFDDPDPQDLEYISQIKRVLELLRRNRDMTFNEVKLTIMIEDPRDVERKRLLGIDDENAPTRDDLADALEEVNKGEIPENRLALQMLAEEMVSWPNLEEEAPKNKMPGKSLYAKATDTGIDPKEAAKRLNIDWDAAAED